MYHFNISIHNRLHDEKARPVGLPFLLCVPGVRQVPKKRLLLNIDVNPLQGKVFAWPETRLNSQQEKRVIRSVFAAARNTFTSSGVKHFISTLFFNGSSQ